MRRLANILALTLVIGLLAAPSAFGKSLQPPLPPEARSAPTAQSSAGSGDVVPITVAAGLAVLFVGAVLRPRTRKGGSPAPA